MTDNLKAGDKVIIKQEKWSWGKKRSLEFREPSSPVCTVVRQEENGFLLDVPNHNYMIFHRDDLEKQ